METRSFSRHNPYRAPENFLQQIESNVWEAVGPQLKAEAAADSGSVTALRPRRKLGRWLYPAAAVAAAACVLVAVLPSGQSQDMTKTDFTEVETSFHRLSDADQDYLLANYDDDLFMNQ